MNPEVCKSEADGFPVYFVDIDSTDVWHNPDTGFRVSLDHESAMDLYQQLRELLLY